MACFSMLRGGPEEAMAHKPLVGIVALALLASASLVLASPPAAATKCIEVNPNAFPPVDVYECEEALASLDLIDGRLP